MDLLRRIFGWLTLTVWIALFAVAEHLRRNPGNRPLLVAACVLLAVAIPTIPISVWLYRGNDDAESEGGLIIDPQPGPESVASSDWQDSSTEFPSSGD